MEIKIKTITKTIQQNTEVYVAKDGKEFDNRKACEIYEARQTLNGMKICDIFRPDVWDDCSTADVGVYILRCSDDVNKLIDACKVLIADYADNYVEESIERLLINNYPRKIILYESDTCIDVMPFEVYVRQITKIMQDIAQ